MFRRKLKETRIKKKWINKNIRTNENGWMRKIKSRTGSSLIMVVCVSAFLVAFALAMVYTGSMLMARANRRLEQERCYQLASSFAQVLDGELARYSGQELETPPDANYDDSFYCFACKLLEDPLYQEYSPEHPELTTYYYRLGKDDAGAGEDYGKITIILYKESDQETDVLEGSFLYNPGSGSGGTDANPIDKVMENFSRFTFNVEVVAELDGITYSYSTAYDTQVKYTDDAVTFTVGDKEVRWVDNQWLDNTNQPVNVPADALINYKINPELDKLRSCIFKRTISEGENP